MSLRVPRSARENKLNNNSNIYQLHKTITKIKYDCVCVLWTRPYLIKPLARGVSGEEINLFIFIGVTV